MEIARERISEQIEVLRSELEQQCNYVDGNGKGLEELYDLSRKLDLLIVDYLKAARDGAGRK